MPAPTSKAAAGKSTDGATPPLGGSGAAVVCPPLATRVSCAMAVGTRISIATRADPAHLYSSFLSNYFSHQTVNPLQRGALKGGRTPLPVICRDFGIARSAESSAELVSSREGAKT